MLTKVTTTLSGSETEQEKALAAKQAEAAKATAVAKGAPPPKEPPPPEPGTVLTVDFYEQLNPFVGQAFEGATVDKLEVHSDDGGLLHVHFELGGPSVASKLKQLSDKHTKDETDRLRAAGVIVEEPAPAKPALAKKSEEEDEEEEKKQPAGAAIHGKPAPGQPLRR